MSYLNSGLPHPVAAGDGLDREYWEGLSRGELLIQRCRACRTWQWGPEWLCHACHGFDLGFEPVSPAGEIYSYERVWHPVHPALAEQGPYLVVLVSLRDRSRMKYKMLVGRDFLAGDFLVDAARGESVD